MTDFLSMLVAWTDALPNWLEALTTVVAACTAITVLTPTRADDVWINRLLKTLNTLAGNVGKNRNADDI